MLPFIIAGLVSGSVYGLAGVGLVLTYKTSGIFNFAFGSISTLAAYVFYFLWVKEGLPWPVSVLIVLLAIGVGLGVLFEQMAKRLIELVPALQVVATVGVVLIVEAVAIIWYGTLPVPVPSFLPTHGYEIGGLYVSLDQIIIFVIAAAVSVGLSVFFRVSRTGMAMKAVVDNPDLLDLVGTNPNRVRRLAWIIGTTFAAATGVLLVPSVGLNATLLTLLVIQAFGAAAIGFFSSLPRTYIGGLLIGVAASVATKYIHTGSWLGGLPASLPFILLVIILVVTPRRRLILRRAVPPAPPRQPWRAPPRVRVGTGLLCALVLVLLPFFVGTNLVVWQQFLIYVLAFLSLGLVVKDTGQISLCHLGFMAIGAAAFGHFAGSDGVPWGLAVVCAGLIVVPVGALIAGTAIRLSGVFLALATFGFAVFLENMIYPTNLMFGLISVGIQAPRPSTSWLSSDKGFYWLVLAIVIVTVLAISVLNRLRLGRLLRALGDSPGTLETQGVPVTVTRLWVFCISAFIAGIAGALLASQMTFVSGSSFTSTGSLTVFVLIVLALGAEPWYALIAALGLTVIPGYVHLGNITYYLQILFGVSAIQVALTQDHLPHLPASFRRFLERIGSKPKAAPAAVQPARSNGALPVSPVAAATADPVGGFAGDAGRGLEVSNLCVRYGGLLAVDDLSLKAPIGRITGLIGPNGAGKTSAFSACTGLVRPPSGSVSLHGLDVTRLSPAARARRGLGRTFQHVALFPSMTVIENIVMSAEAMRAGQSPVRQLAGKPGEHSEFERLARTAAELTGISDLLNKKASDLSTGQQRLVELARTVAGGFDVLLLDEPSSGLDESETAKFAQLLTDIARERDMAILLVEHDMSLVMNVCEYIYVMDFGRLIFEGKTGEVTESSLVRAAYLGEEVQQIAAAG
jgi:ABC-type branched-subunit amino acid transport system ATPase component/branched-subunit amino acid ABC-type transport system permease component